MVLSVVSRSETCTWVKHHVRPAFIGHVLQPGHSAQAERIVQDESPARTHRRWCVCDSVRQRASQMLTFRVVAHPEVFETIRWWLPYSCKSLNEKGLQRGAGGCGLKYVRRPTHRSLEQTVEVGHRVWRGVRKFTRDFPRLVRFSRATNQAYRRVCTSRPNKCTKQPQVNRDCLAPLSTWSPSPDDRLKKWPR